MISLPTITVNRIVKGTVKTIAALLVLLALGAEAAPTFQTPPDPQEAEARRAALTSNTVVVNPATKTNSSATNASAAPKPAQNPELVPATPVPAPQAAPAVTVTPPATNVEPAAPAAPAVPSAPAIPAPAAPVTNATTPSIPGARPVPTRRSPSTTASTAPALPAPTAAAAKPATTAAPFTGEVTGKAINAAGDTIPAGMIRFQAMPLEQVLDIYADLVGRTLLRPSSLPAAAITIRAQTDLTRAEAIAALDSVLGMNGIATVPFGEKFMKVVPTTSVNTEGAPLNELDPHSLPDVGGYVTHVVQLKYSKPSEVIQALGTFSKIQGSVQALDSNGILIIRDFTENVKRMLELIERIDVAIPSEFVSEVIPIRYATATEIASALNSVGGTTSGSIGAAATGTPAGTTTGRTAGQSTSPFGNRTGGTGTTGSGYQGGNTGNRFGTQQSGANPAGGGGGAGGGAQTFQQRLANILRSNGSGGAGDVQLIGPNKIIADERTNSLLVFATREDMDMIKSIIAKLDVVLAQVLIEAVIMDVTLGNNFDFGVSAAQKPKTYQVNATGTNNLLNNIIGAGGMNNGQTFLNFLNSSIGTNTSGTFGDRLGNGLSYFGNIGPTWEAAITAVAGSNKGKILARPRIQTSHNAPATFFVGETRPYVTGTTTDYNGQNRAQYSQLEIGIRLTVTPLINSEGLVVMDIQQEANQANGDYQIDDQTKVPLTQNQNASAKVSVRNGDTIVMGGFIQNNKSDTRSGVPLLQDIPLLGGLFRSTSTKANRRELLVMIRPTVLPTPEAAALQPRIERDRLPAVKEAEIEFNREDVKLLKAADQKEKADQKRQDDEERAAAAAAAAAKEPRKTKLHAP